MKGEAATALAELDEIAHRLRRECPWDREQDARSIVPHTVEEAYELADAVRDGNPAEVLDELGDVLFQVVFLSLLAEEKGEGDLAAVAEHVTEKLVRRHPHVFEDAEAADAAAVRESWDRVKRDREGRGGGVAEGVAEALPSLLYARKLMRRAAGAGAEAPVATPDELGEQLEHAARCAAGELPRGSSGGPASPQDERERAEQAVAELLWLAVAAARELEVDPELALRERARRFAREA